MERLWCRLGGVIERPFRLGGVTDLDGERAGRRRLSRDGDLEREYEREREELV